MLSLSFVALLTLSNAHSWLRCSKYTGPMVGYTDYNDAKYCKGWIRDEDFRGVSFGQDRGVNEFGGPGKVCGGRVKPLSNAAKGYPGNYAYGMKPAQYIIGEEIRLVWPAKNHANFECGKHIPDTSMKLFINPTRNPEGVDPEMDEWEMLVDFQKGCRGGTDGCGFQNCVDFCTNKDKATCWGDFTMPSKLPSGKKIRPGYYSFMWYWIFNRGNRPYVSCYEAYVSDTGNIKRLPQGPAKPKRPEGDDDDDDDEDETNKPTRGGKVTLSQMGYSRRWFLAFQIKGGGCENAKVQVRGGANYPNWVSAKKQGNFLSVNNNGKPFQLPLDVKVGGKLVNKAITSFGGKSNLGDFNCKSEAIMFEVTYEEAMGGLVLVNAVVLAAILVKKCRSKEYAKLAVYDESDSEI